MITALEEAFKAASKRAEAAQHPRAEVMRAEIEAEKYWDKSFAGSLDVLERLADEAISDHRAGRTKRVDPEKM